MTVIEKSVKVLFVNETETVQVSEEVFRGHKVKVPARHVLFTCELSRTGDPLYEMADLDYVSVKKNKDGTTSLVAMKLLENEIKARDSLASEYEDPVQDGKGSRSSRVLHMVQYYRNSRTGERLPHDADVFASELQKRSSIERGTIYVHEEDVYTRLDEKKHLRKLKEAYVKNPDTEEGGLERYIARHQVVFAGNPKPAHIHAPVKGKTGSDGKGQSLKAELVAQWLGISPSCFKYVIDNSSKGGNDGFLDAVAYGTHEDEESQKAGKTMYDDSIYVASWEWRNGRVVDWDWRASLESRKEDNDKYGMDSPTLLQKWMHDLLYGEKTLRDCKAEDWELYAKNLKKLEAWRLDYFQREAPLPRKRLNIYVEGLGGMAKDEICKAVARMAYPDLDDEQIWFEAAKGAGFLGYDGQPVVIWTEYRSWDLKKELKGRSNVFATFDVIPKRQKQNVKYGAVKLVNELNIVNSTQPYEEFLEDLCIKSKDDGDTEEAKTDKSQPCRRFPMMLVLHEQDFEIMLNRGFIEDRRDLFEDYILYKHISGNFGNMMRKLGDSYPAEVKRIGDSMVRPIVEKVRELSTPKVYDDEELAEVMQEFESYGKEISDEEIADSIVSELSDAHCAAVKELETRAAEHPDNPGYHMREEWVRL